MAFATKNVGLEKHTGMFYEGKEIVLAQKQGVPIKQERHNRNWFPEDTKIQAATIFAVTKNLQQTGTLSKVPVSVLRKWQKEPWWDNVIRRVIHEENEELDAKFTEILKNAAQIVLDRLTEGDYVVTKAGELIRKPVDLRSAAIAQAIIFDKRQLLRGEATSRTENISEPARLEKLADQFRKNAQITKKDTDITDVEYIEVKDEESKASDVL